MIEVRVRHSGEAEGVWLGEFPVSDLENLVKDIRRWGGVDMNGNPGEDPRGRFVADDRHCWFEVIVGDEE